jgi:arabinan endo-1,5-alpha-L-arabinosidase
MRPILAIALVGAALSLSSAGEEADAVLHVRDPSIVVADGRHYVFSTGKGIRILVSEDLARWRDVGHVFSRVPGWAAKAAPGQDIWAPDISRIGDRWHIYYSVSVVGTNRSFIGLAVNKTLDPEAQGHRWEDRGLVLESRPGRDDWNALNPHVATDGEGRPWLFWGSFWSGIKAAPIDPASGMLAQPVRMVDIARRRPTNAIDAPFVVRRGEWFYLFVSFDHTGRGAASDYKTMVGRSKALLGPYVDRSGRRLLDGGGTLLAASHGRWRGPGNSSVIETERGWLLVHHVNDAEKGGADRLQLRPLLWQADGWPVAADPESRGAWSGTFTGEPTGRWHHSADFGPETELEIASGGTIREHDPVRWSLVDGRTLVLRWPRADAPGGTWVDRCLLSADGRWYVGRNQNGSVIRGRRVTE